MTCVAIMQPTYLPWMGYFKLIVDSDIFVFLDDVQFSKGSWQHRNRIVSRQDLTWLTVPVFHSGRFGQTIADVEINDGTSWRQKHLRTIAQSYAKAPYFDEVFPCIERWVADPNCVSLRDMNTGIITSILELLGIEREMKFSSEIPSEGKKSEKILDICKSLGAETYLSPKGAWDYITAEGVFEREEFDVQFQDFTPPRYRNLPTLDSGAFPSIIDALAHAGAAATRGMIDADRREPDRAANE